jgi:hypothetical protein
MLIFILSSFIQKSFGTCLVINKGQEQRKLKIKDRLEKKNEKLEKFISDDYPDGGFNG